MPLRPIVSKAGVQTLCPDAINNTTLVAFEDFVPVEQQQHPPFYSENLTDQYPTSGTHFGAPLKNGVLTPEGRLICPWHGACFKVSTGDVEDAPALDPLSKYEVFEKDGAVFVKSDEATIKANRRSLNFKCSSVSDEKVLVIGGYEFQQNRSKWYILLTRRQWKRNYRRYRRPARRRIYWADHGPLQGRLPTL